MVLTVFFRPGTECAPRSTTRKIDRSLAIDVEAAENSNRAVFPLKSKAKKFDGSSVGFWPSAEKICLEKSARYHHLKSSSGSQEYGIRQALACVRCLTVLCKTRHAGRTAGGGVALA